MVIYTVHVYLVYQLIAYYIHILEYSVVFHVIGDIGFHTFRETGRQSVTPCIELLFLHGFVGKQPFKEIIVGDIPGPGAVLPYIEGMVNTVDKETGSHHPHVRHRALLQVRKIVIAPFTQGISLLIRSQAGSSFQIEGEAAQW